MGHRRKRRSFETPRKRAAPQDDGKPFFRAVIASEAKQSSSGKAQTGLLRRKSSSQ
jgi:hypothetical protein